MGALHLLRDTKSRAVVRLVYDRYRPLFAKMLDNDPDDENDEDAIDEIAKDLASLVQCEVDEARQALLALAGLDELVIDQDTDTDIASASDLDGPGGWHQDDG